MMMTTMPCPTDERLRDLTLGKLSQPESDDLFDHVQACAHCQAELDTLGAHDDSFVEALRTPSELGAFQAEANCQVAMVRALGVLANAKDADCDDKESPIPKKFGEYEVVRRIGQGGMGCVYLARHIKLGREVAIKVLSLRRMSDSRVLERFDAEMRAIGRLSHPNIVVAYDAREVDGVAVLVTEYVEGFDLGALLKRTGPLSLANACEIIRQVAAALEYTHQQGFVHRDVKPGNVMLSRDGRVKLLDLGLARLQYPDELRPELTGTGQAMGTADYIAPEQVTDCRTVDARADIYSLGCTLYKLLTGSAPFENDLYPTVFSKLTAQVSVPAPSLSDNLPAAPLALVKLVDSMLVKSLQHRIPRLSDIISALGAFAASSDLCELMKQAERHEPQSGLPQRSSVAGSLVNSQQERSLLARRVPVAYLAVASIASAAGGFLLGMMLTIKQPDGTVVQYRVPEGSQVTISNDSDVSSTSSATAVPRSSTPRSDLDVIPDSTDGQATAISTATARTETGRVAEQDLRSMPLFFGLLSDVGGLDSQGVWIEIGPDVRAQGETRVANGVTQYLVDNQEQNLIPWSELVGHVTAGFTNGNIGLMFDDRLTQRMGAFTEANLGRQLAMVLNGKLVAAPKIVSRIGNHAELFGLNRDESEFLRHALSGLVPSVGVAPAPNAAEFGGLGLAGGGLPPGPNSVRPGEALRTEDQRTTDNLKRIAIALHNYEATHRRLPASANQQRDGQAVQHPYSWRVAILPFLGPEAAKLYAEYDFSQPWDSETNRRLLAKMPNEFRSAGMPDNGEGNTSYFGFVGPHCAWGEREGKAFREFTDGMSNTLLLLEAKQVAKPWTCPEDLPFQNAEDVRQVRRDDGQLMIVMADGSVLSVNAQSDEELATLRAKITIDGAEPINIRSY